MSEQSNRLRRRLRHPVRLALASVVLAGALYVVANQFVAPSMVDSLDVTLQTRSVLSPAAPQLIFAKTFSDAATIQETEDAIDSLPRWSPLANFNCPPNGRGSQEYVYTFRFSWHGLLVREAQVTYGGCFAWTITTLGLRNIFTRTDVRGDIMGRLQALTGVPRPPSG